MLIEEVEKVEEIEGVEKEYTKTTSKTRDSELTAEEENEV